MKKTLILIPIILLLTACGDVFDSITSNITDDSIWSLTHNYLGWGMPEEQCRIPAASPQPANPNPASKNYVPSHYDCYQTQMKKICGYDCKVANGRIKCGYLPAQRCLVGSSGYIVCGYDCKKTWREANCGIRYGDTCVVDKRQRVICGLNCHDQDGYVKCEPSPTFRAAFPQGPWP